MLCSILLPVLQFKRRLRGFWPPCHSQDTMHCQTQKVPARRLCQNPSFPLASCHIECESTCEQTGIVPGEAVEQHFVRLEKTCSSERAHDHSCCELVHCQAESIPLRRASCRHQLRGLLVALAITTDECCSREPVATKSCYVTPQHVAAEMHNSAATSQVASQSLQQMFRA